MCLRWTGWRYLEAKGREMRNHWLPLMEVKPKSRSKASSVAHSVAVQPHFGGYMRNVGVGQGYHPTPLTFLLIKYIVFTQRRDFWGISSWRNLPTDLFHISALFAPQQQQSFRKTTHTVNVESVHSYTLQRIRHEGSSRQLSWGVGKLRTGCHG